jgi:hypothetical protein
MATPAPTCVAALKEATALYPNRSRLSDGIMGDASHALSTSDHNLGNAFDLTHDPAHGCDAHKMVEELKQKKDSRVKYIISNGRIWNPSISPDWRPYWGINRHTKHAHVSIYTESRNDLRAWWSKPWVPTEIIGGEMAWEKLEGTTLSGVAVAKKDDRIDIFIRGDDNACWHNYWNGSYWVGWESLGGETIDTPGAEWSVSPAHLHVFVRGTDNGIYYKWWDGAKWNPV